MREILFRGKRIDNGKWAEGGIAFEDYTDKAYIVQWNTFGLGFFEYIEVDPNTVGQYTGLYGADDRPIYEGDILMWDDGEWGCTHNELVMWDYELFAMRKRDWQEWCIVIGNIHDNPELLEVDNG